jgi:hypothetical protein
MSSLVRFHQLTGPNQKRVAFSLSSNIQYKMDDTPTKAQICGKKYVSSIPWMRLTFDLTFTNPHGSSSQLLTRDLVNRTLINQIQVDGTLLGTIISAAHTKGNMLDTLEFVANGGKMKSHVYNNFIIPHGATATIRHEIAVPFGFYGCPSPLAMSPMASLIRPGNIKIDAPSAMPAEFSTTGTTVTGFVTASLEVLWRDEIVMAPGFQMTRFKSTATAGINSDTVVLNSFGANSTLVGVERGSAIAGLLWATSLLTGDGTGAGLASSITDLSGLFAGIEQTNDIYPIIKQLVDEYITTGHNIRSYNSATVTVTPGTAGGDAVIGSAVVVEITPTVEVPYPLFDPLWAPGPGANPTGGDLSGLQSSARFVPIFPPRRKSHVSKFPIADGNPSFQLSGNFTNPDHYTYLFGIYRWTDDAFRAQMDALKNDGIGMFLYGTNELTDVLKNAKKQPAQDINFSKAHYLPRKMLPLSMVSG